MRSLLLVASLAAALLCPHARAVPGCEPGGVLWEKDVCMGASRDPTPLVGFVTSLPGQLVWVCFDENLTRCLEDMPCG